MQNAFEAGTIVALFAGVVGYFMVTRGQSFAGHTLSQVGFPGAAGAALVGAPPLLGLLIFCSAAALGIAAFSNPRSQERRAETAAIGAILVFVLALGFLFASLSQDFLGTVYSIRLARFWESAMARFWYCWSRRRIAGDPGCDRPTLAVCQCRP